ncbi:MAG: DUF3368 domain-containing protein [Selenomonadaceae bacterium]|nr:DUF3368 domain-containing protein [Selenomonadaceae bacterium]
MIVIADTSPLITLMKVDKLYLLHELFGEVSIPPAVYAELTANPAFAHEAQLIEDCHYIKMVKVDNPEQVNLVRRVAGLDLGEAEAIVYAYHHTVDLLLMDEAKGRQVAKNMNIPLTGSLGVLVKSYQRGLIEANEVEVALAKLRKANRRISEQLMRDVMAYIHSSK